MLSRKNILIRHCSGRQQERKRVFKGKIKCWIKFIQPVSWNNHFLTLLQNHELTSTSDFETFHCFGTTEKNVSEFLWSCLGYQKFCFHDCILGGSLISCVVGGSQILNPLQCYLGDQKFLILSCVVWGTESEILTPLPCCLGVQKFWLLSFVVREIRNSESSPVLFRGSEIVAPLLCCLGDQKFWILFCVVWGIRNSESSPVFLGDQKFWILCVGGSEILNPLLCCLGEQISEILKFHDFPLCLKENA